MYCQQTDNIFGFTLNKIILFFLSVVLMCEQKKKKERRLKHNEYELCLQPSNYCLTFMSTNDLQSLVFVSIN